MSVSARFYVMSITRYAYNASNAEVKLQASTRGEENKAWSSATPSGSITMAITNGSASDWFEKHLGKDVAILFQDVEDPSVTT